MKKNRKAKIPIRTKKEMTEDVIQIISHLHRGERRKSDALIKDLKTKASHFSKMIQQDVLQFSEQVQFQYDYDPWHKVTPEVQKAADRLLRDLGIIERASSKNLWI